MARLARTLASLLSADQLGLKLVPAKNPMDTIIVDRIEKPSAN